MTNYTNFEVEDFLHDDFFIDSVLKNAPNHQIFWEQWLAEHPDRKSAVTQAREIILSIRIKPLTDELSDSEVNDIIANLQQQTLSQPQFIGRKFYQTGWFRIAAAALLFATALLVVFRVNNRQLPDTENRNIASSKPATQTNELLEVTNHTTQAKLVRMSDGSLAVLKPGSGLKYQKYFSQKREVFLDGEAFFEVHKNPQMPFFVHSHDMAVRVLGTSFTVKNQNDNTFKVVVNTGKVLVYNQKAAQKANKEKYEVTLVPNEQVTYAINEFKFKKESLAVPLILSKEVALKEFTFENAALADIIEKIDKAYGVNIEYDKAKLGNISLNASLSDRPLDEKVKLLCKAINASCAFIDGRIIINGQTP
ncbi:FecR family protein [Mucilaginibacter pineti]|uniref:FecR family protein n=1 Tax=Mucilaginibacter pineti TaxID=1391627 RepID=A0A1G6ZSJ3_9SPHI|nr:FecR family protein [Mucilaginibacter pineti]SDE05502.1 FecR family protein [Mucilaginibacter pineti]